MLSEQPVFGTHEMVAYAHYLATQVGISMPTQRGNALDAASTAHTIVKNSQTPIFAHATSLHRDGLAPGW